VKPGHAGIDVGHRDARRLVRPCDHHDRQAESARRLDLGVCRATAGILGHDDLDPLVAQQALFVGSVERPARLQEPEVGRQHRLLRQLDQPREIVVLWRRGESMQVLAAEAQKHTPRLGAEGRRGGEGVGNDLPAVVGATLPFGTHQGRQRHSGLAAGRDGMGGHLVGVGMRGIDDGLDLVVAQEAGEALDAAKAAAAGRNRLWPRLGRAAGERQDRREPRVARDLAGQCRGLDGAAEDQDSQGHGRE